MVAWDWINGVVTWCLGLEFSQSLAFCFVSKSCVSEDCFVSHHGMLLREDAFQSIMEQHHHCLDQSDFEKCCNDAVLSYENMYGEKLFLGAYCFFLWMLSAAGSVVSCDFCR